MRIAFIALLVASLTAVAQAPGGQQAPVAPAVGCFVAALPSSCPGVSTPQYGPADSSVGPILAGRIAAIEMVDSIHRSGRR